MMEGMEEKLRNRLNSVAESYSHDLGWITNPPDENEFVATLTDLLDTARYRLNQVGLQDPELDAWESRSRKEQYLLCMQICSIYVRK